MASNGQRAAHGTEKQAINALLERVSMFSTSGCGVGGVFVGGHHDDECMKKEMLMKFDVRPYHRKPLRNCFFRVSFFAGLSDDGL